MARVGWRGRRWLSGWCSVTAIPTPGGPRRWPRSRTGATGRTDAGPACCGPSWGRDGAWSRKGCPGGPPFIPIRSRACIRRAGAALAVLESHRPVDLVVLDLGTNDLKARFAVPVATSPTWSRGCARLVRQSDTGPGPGAAGGAARRPAAGDRDRLPRGDLREGASAKSARLVAGLCRGGAGGTAAGFRDAGAVIASSPLDGVHFDAAEHGALGRALAGALRAMILKGLNLSLGRRGDPRRFRRRHRLSRRRPPRMGETILGNGVQGRAGRQGLEPGDGGGAARGRGALVTRIGDDTFADMARSLGGGRMRRGDGDPDSSTGAACIFVHEDGRQRHHRRRGAAASIGPADVEAAGGRDRRREGVPDPARAAAGDGDRAGCRARRHGVIPS